MQVFVSEFVCSGAWPEPVLPPSLAREGRAMLLALLNDIAALPGIDVCTTWDSRLGPFSLRDSIADGSPLAIECEVVRSPADELAAFQRLTSACDATYVIAPELDDLLTRRVGAVLDAGGRCLNASTAAVAACSDKWATFQRLLNAGIPTVATAPCDPRTPALPFEFPMVIKPRFGAGSHDTFLIQNREEFSSAAARFPADRPTTEAILQPFVPGRALSVAGIFRSDGTFRELWPVGEQRLSGDGRFSYVGGRVGQILDSGFWISDLLERVAAAVPGLRGYVGFDLIVPESPDAAPLIVDINPRLTTSYLGYRALSCNNLSGRILWPDNSWPEPDWSTGCVEFHADGRASLQSPSESL